MKIKKFLTVIVSVAILLGVMPFGSFTTNAVKKYIVDGYYTYTITNGTATITDCDNSISGDVTVPSTLGGYSVTGIGEHAFDYCRELTGVIIPNSVISIGEYAFEYCESLASITIPDSVTSIGHNPFFSTEYYYNDSNWENNVLYIGNHLIEAEDISGEYEIKAGTKTIADDAFYSCESLTSIEIPDSVTSIGYDAFYDCENLTSINLPDSITSIGMEAFYNTAYYNDSSNWENDVLYIGNHLIRAEDISGEYAVKAGTKTIADEAFSGCYNNLTSVTLPNGVTSIGYEAFAVCWDLTSINIPDSVITIGDGAFNSCDSLKEITIPDSVKSIGNEVFHSCCSLTRATILGNITVIGYEAFSECESLTSVALPDSVEFIGKQAFYGCGALTSITLPDGVTSIGDYAFEGCYSLTKINIPDSVKFIGDRAFGYCESLASITIPDSVVSIGYEAFSACYSLTSITVDEKNQYYCSVDGVLFDKSMATLICYPSRKTNTVYTVPDGVTSICSYAFYRCESLTSITLPNSIISIGAMAFNYCRSLTSITLPNSIISIGAMAFNYCRSLTSVTIPDGITSIAYDTFSNCESLTSITIPDSVTSIDENAFSSCVSLKSITLPDSVTSIGRAAFVDTAYYNNSSNWENNVLYIGNHLICAEDISGEYEIKAGTKTIADEAFGYCSELTGVIIPDGVISIGYEAFSDCESLTSIKIADSVISIGEYAFYETAYYNNSSNWENDVLYIDNHLIEAEHSSISGKYEIKAGTKTIADAAFYSCVRLESITLPEGITSIGKRAFDSCYDLTSITLPDSVTNIGDGAFSNCIYLTSINVDENNQYYCSVDGVLFDKSMTTLISYPIGKTNTVYTIPDGVKSIGNQAFVWATLTSINLPDSVITIGDNAFSGCEITEITIPDSVKSIGKEAFGNCYKLKSITLSDSVTNIGDMAFCWCENLCAVYYCGTSEQWDKISIERINSELTSATRYYHRISDWQLVISATSKTNGLKCGNCSICGEKVTEIIPAIGHDNTEDFTLPSSAELVLLRKELLADGQNNSCYDYNGDSEVDIRDLIRLKNYLAR